MKKIIALLLCIVLIVPFGLMTGCSDENVLTIYNWGDYIADGVIDKFTEETGVKVRYTTFDTNEIMYTKVTNSDLGSYDIVIPSDYTVHKLRDADMLEKLDFSNIPNYQYIGDNFKNLPFDPDNEYSVPYMWGTLAIVYDTTKVDDPVDSWDILWNEKYEKQIFMMDSVRDSIGISLKRLGYTMNSTNDEEIAEAKQELINQKPLVLAYTGDEVKDKMVAGEAALAVVYAGDGVTIVEQNPNMALAIPSEEGSNYFVDSMCILKGSKHKEAAEQFINFMCREDIAEMNREAINYSSPQTQVMANLPADMLCRDAMYPSDEIIEKCDVFAFLDKYESIYIDTWTQVIAAN